MDALDNYDLGNDISTTTTTNGADTTPESPHKRKEESAHGDEPVAKKQRKMYMAPAKPVKAPANRPINLKDFVFSRDAFVCDPQKDSRNGIYYPLENAHHRGRLQLYLNRGCKLPRHGCSEGYEDKNRVYYNVDLDESMWGTKAVELLKDTAEYCVSKGMVKNVTDPEKVIGEDYSKCIIKPAGPNQDGKHRGTSLKLTMGKFAKVYEEGTDDEGNPVRYAITPTPAANKDADVKYETLCNREVKTLVLNVLSIRYMKKMMSLKCMISYMLVGPAADPEEEAYGFDYLTEDV